MLVVGSPVVGGSRRLLGTMEVPTARCVLGLVVPTVFAVVLLFIGGFYAKVFRQRQSELIGTMLHLFRWVSDVAAGDIDENLVELWSVPSVVTLVVLFPS